MVKRVAAAVIVESDGLLVVAGRQRPSDSPRVFGAETGIVAAYASVFVYVVAKENHGVYVRVGSSGNVTVDVEVALLVVSARKHRQGDPAHVARGEGFGASGHGGFASRPEPVVVDRRRGETLNVRLYRVVRRGRRGQFGRVHDVGEPVVCGDLDAHFFGRPARGDPGPENHPVRKGVAACHPVTENRVVGVAARGDAYDGQSDEKRYGQNTETIFSDKHGRFLLRSLQLG